MDLMMIADVLEIALEHPDTRAAMSFEQIREARAFREMVRKTFLQGVNAAQTSDLYR